MYKHIPFGLLLGLSVCLASCGGSSGTNVVDDPLNPPAAYDLASAGGHYGIGGSGIGGNPGGDAGANGGAGDGAPLRNAVVTLTDSRGNQETGQTDDNGRYLIKYNSAVFVAPFVLRVVDAGGNVLTSVLETAPAAGTSALVNINPLTDKITSDSLLPDTAGVTGTDKVFDGSRIDTAKLPQAKADLTNSIKSALLATGYSDVSKFDAVKSLYSQDGTGVDAVVESLSHSRDSAGGLTQLSVKLAALSNDATSGLVQPTLVTAGSPLPANKLVLQSSPALTYDKLQAWMAAMNRCLALEPAIRPTDTECNNVGGDRMISTGYLNNGNSDSADFSLPVGSTLRNPVVLFTNRYTGSSIDDAAWVEFTVHQGAGPTARDWTRVLTFKRDDALVQAKAGNWILNGNQGIYGCAVTTQYLKQIQFNPASTTLSSISSGMGLGCNATGIEYVIVTGPGLPGSGITMAINASLGGLNIDNKNGLPPASGTTSQVGSIYILSAIDPTSGTPIDWASRTNTPTNATTPVTDFSAYQAYAKYKYEIHLTAGGTVNEYAYNFAPVVSPVQVMRFQFNDLTPSQALVEATSTSLPVSTLIVLWTNNLNAAPIDSVFVQAGDASGSVSAGAGVNVAYTSNNRPTSQMVTASTGSFPALNANGAAAYRMVVVRSNRARASILDTLMWTP